MENKKQVFLSLETAKEMYKSSDKAIKQFALDNFTKEELEAKELPKTWEELRMIKGYFIHSDVSKVSSYVNTTLFDKNKYKYKWKNIFPTKELAEASLALAQLLQLRDVYNGDWKVDLNNKPNEERFIIYNNYNHIACACSHNGSNYILSFKDINIRNQFFNNFTELLETALPLL